MYKALFLWATILLISWCSYVRPPAWVGVKDTQIGWSIDTKVTTQTWILDGNTNTGTISRGKNATPERAKAILSHLKLASWFQIEVFAQVPNARSMALAYDEQRNRQIIFVGNKNKSSVYALIDEDSDYTINTVKEIVKWRSTPNGIAFYSGNLYVAQVSKVHEFPDILNQLDTTGSLKSTVVYDELPKDTHHGWKYIAFGPDGKLYIPVGIPCNICDKGDPYGAIISIDLDTKKSTIVAKGMRNTVWFSWHPDTKQLRFTDNGRDLLGDDRPDDELNVVREPWEHFWIPFCYNTWIQDPSFPGKDCNEFTAPVVLLGAHVAALGMKFYTGSQFPESYKNKVFIAEHGSRNSTVPVGYRVVVADTEKKSYEVFISWWVSEGKTWWRPVDVLELKDGSLLISDDYAGLIYRVAYVGD